jgi:predicted MPP superfamily phosphohydrolase
MKKAASHEGAFLIFELGVVLFGLIVAWLSFRAGGIWNWLGAAALFGEALLAYGVFIETHRLRVTTYREELRPHPSVWMKIAFLSDFHAGGSMGKDWWERVATETAALAPDVIVLGGDYVVESFDTINELLPLTQLRAPLGVFFLLGNHDFLDRPEDIRSWLVDKGFADLTNRSITVHRDGRDLEIQGLDDHWYGAPQDFERTSPAIAHLLIAHEPDALLDLEEGKTDLMLAGHTHGGQVRVPGIGALWVPTNIGRKVSGGPVRLNGVRALISRGLGQSAWEPRLGARPEIVIVEAGI